MAPSAGTNYLHALALAFVATCMLGGYTTYQREEARKVEQSHRLTQQHAESQLAQAVSDKPN